MPWLKILKLELMYFGQNPLDQLILPRVKVSFSKFAPSADDIP